MKEEKLLKLMQVMSDAHWTFKGVISTDELPVRDGEKEYYKKYYGDKFLMFKRIYSYNHNCDDFFSRQYEEKFISYNANNDCFAEIKHDWHIPGKECEWDEEYHITYGAYYGISGCLCEGGESLETEQSWKNICDKLCEENVIFY